MRHPLVYWPKAEEPVAVVGPEDVSAPWDPARPLKVLTWNVQYAAGRGYVFFYDTIPWGGPDERPSPFAVAHTLEGLAAVIEQQDPDVVLLQEVDVGADRTDRVDQARFFRRRLPQYPFSAATWYWRSAFVAHPRVRGAVGLQLLILSRYRLTSARRVPLPLIPGPWLRQAFGFKRCVLTATVETAGPAALRVAATHFDAFAQGSDTMARQVQVVERLVTSWDPGPWVIGGDFNLVASGAERRALDRSQWDSYSPETELAALQRWPSVPSLADLAGGDRPRWLTYHPNEPVSAGPDRAIDYLFHSQALRRGHAAVLREPEVSALSDHLPIVATLLPAEGDEARTPPAEPNSGAPETAAPPAGPARVAPRRAGARPPRPKRT